MTQNLDLAINQLLLPGSLSDQHLQSILNGMLTSQLDYADLYFQSCLYESWSLEDSLVKEGSFHVESGVGVRAVSGQKSGFAYSDEISLAALTHAADAVKSIARQGDQQEVKIQIAQKPIELYQSLNPLHEITQAEKIQLLQQIDQLARSLDPRVEQVMASLSGVYETVLVMASDGTYAADVRPLVRLNVTVIAAQNGKRERGTCGGGGRYSYQVLLAEKRAERYTREAVRQALINLEAQPAPAGTMPVVLGPGWPGVLLHEAIGHGLEGDFNRKGSSAFTGRIGERVASPLCTIVDDGTLPGRRGSLQIDDEGTVSQCTTLIENGILKGYMQDKMNARLMGVKPTGNGRRESYSHQTMPRMTNTYLLPGPHQPEEIIASVDKGIYAVNFAGGQVDITSGKFVFSASEAYLIEKGKIICPIKGATLIGSGPEVLTKVSMLGNDLALDEGVGVCGKDGQSVPVGVGQPTLKIDALTVGGTNS